MIAALLLRASSGCGGPSSGGSAGAAPVMDDPYCSRFGLRFATTCDACPAEPITCPCFSGDIGFSPLQRCNFGRCLLDVDCTEICRAISGFLSDAVHGSPVPPDLMEEVTRFPSCVKDRPCRVDSGCGAAGKCVGESASQVGTCTA